MSSSQDNAQQASVLSFFVTCSKGLEGLLENELRECGAQQVRQSVAGVYCTADLRVAYRLMMFSRL